MNSIDPWYMENIVCPVDHTELHFDGHCFVSKHGRHYPVVEGIPVLLVEQEKQTIEVAQASIQRAQGRSDVIDRRAPQLYLETLAINEDERAELVRLYEGGGTVIDPVVMMIIGATCGIGYRHLIGNRGLKQYPIPSISMSPRQRGDTLLDVGCNWGRWSISATNRGFSVAGIDPSLGAVMAARRIAVELNLGIRYLVADARFLPFRDNQFKFVYSYSVLQHFCKQDARRTVGEMSRVLEPGGTAKVQMANKWGFRSIQHQALRGFREPHGFEVRYWELGELKSLFTELIGETGITADCYFGLGWQWCDVGYMNWKHKCKLVVSEALRRMSGVVSPIRMLADSVFCTAVK